MRDDAWYTNAYREDGCPIYCTNCGHSEFSNREVLMDGWLLCEYYITCETCGNEVGFWAYGHYHPGYMDNE